MFLTILAHTQHDVIRRLPAQKVHRSDIFLASFTLPRQSGIFSIFPFFWIDVHEWQHLVTSKHIYHWHWNTILVVISKIFGKKPEYYCNISVRSINGTVKNHFDLKFYLSHIFILFLPQVGTLCRIFYHER
jgi:hypothetical protein